MSTPHNSEEHFIVFGSVNTFVYTNHRGETGTRKVVPHALRYGIAEGHHNEPQWLLEVFDVDRQALRTYALKDIRKGTPGRVDTVPHGKPGHHRGQAGNRTVQQVLSERRNPAGCCEDYANGLVCDCLSESVACPKCNDSGYEVHPENGRKVGVRCRHGCRVQCSVCNNPNCNNPGGQH